ncbi:MAG: hypothetical protein AAF653_08335 [Chloroflexota bacterium]
MKKLRIDPAEIASYVDLERRVLKKRYTDNPDAVPMSAWVYVFGELARPERYATARAMFGEKLARLVCFHDPHPLVQLELFPLSEFEPRKELVA